MLSAVFFDFDGVVVDSEPAHCAVFQAVVAEQLGLTLSERDYYEKYLAYTDAEAFAQILRDFHLPSDATTLARLERIKADRMLQLCRQGLAALPGAVELMAQIRAAGLGLAICSGALRAEIEAACGGIGITPYVQQIVAAEDVPAGKPDPAVYRLGRDRLSAALGWTLEPAACLAIEDAPAGIDAARGAGMKVLAVSNSAPPGQLAHADRVVASLADVTVDDLREVAGQ